MFNISFSIGARPGTNQVLINHDWVNKRNLVANVLPGKHHISLFSEHSLDGLLGPDMDH